MKHILHVPFLLILALALSDTGRAQTALEKMDPTLRQIAEELGRPGRGAALVSQAGAGELAMLVRGDAARFRPLVETMGGRLGAVIGDIATVYMPADGLIALASDASTVELEAASAVEFHNDNAAISTGVARARLPVSQGGEGLTGRGVLVGLVETGIDYTHLDFRDPVDTTKSRIHAIWDQNDSYTGERPSYGYGTIWRRAKLENALRSGDWVSVRHRDSAGHGTHTAGTAAGNGAATGLYSGMAPESDIVLVALDLRRSTGLVDALAFIVGQADTLGKPVVINLSLGLAQLPHDGTSLVDVAIDNLVSARPGRVVCASAGNSGRSMVHWGGRLEGGSAWTYVRMVPISYPSDTTRVRTLTFSGLVPERDMSALTLAIEVDSASGTGTPQSLTQWQFIAPMQLQEYAAMARRVPGTRRHPGANITVFTTTFNDQERVLTFSIQDTLAPGFNPMDRFPEGADAFRLVFSGTGWVHLWRSSCDTINPSELIPRPLPNMRSWDIGWAVRSPGSARGALTVGALNNAVTIRNHRGETVPMSSYDSEEGALASFSTAGPTLDGRMKPEIVAPGLGVVSAMSMWSSDALNRSQVVVEGLRHVAKSGTSMSCPVTVGTVALLFQRYPGATSEQIRDAITAGARRDEHTASRGPLPNSFWGYGKLDLAGALRELASGAAPAQRAAPEAAWSLRLEHSDGDATVRIDGTSGRAFRVVLTDVLGREIEQLHRGPTRDGTRLTVRTEPLSAGVYFVTASDGAISRCAALIVP